MLSVHGQEADIDVRVRGNTEAYPRDNSQENLGPDLFKGVTNTRRCKFTPRRGGDR